MTEIFTSDIVPSPSNPRKRFDEAKLQDLAESVRQYGVLEPVIVRPAQILPSDTEQVFDPERYELVAGERRWRAAKLAGLDAIPAIVKELTDAEVLEIQVIENNQREDVSPIEESDGFGRLVALRWPDLQPKERVKELAARIGRTTQYVVGRMKLQALIPESREALEEGLILLGHAHLLATLPADIQKQALAELICSVEWKLGKRCADWSSKRPTDWSVQRFAHWLADSVECDLALAPFDQADAGLVPAAGACTTCPKRTGVQAALFGEAERDACLDRACYNAKLVANGARIAAKVRAEGETKVVFATDYRSLAPEGEKQMQSWQVEGAKHAEGDTLVINPHTGKTFRAALGVEARKKVEKDAKAKEKEKNRVIREYRIRLKAAIEENLPQELDSQSFRTVAAALVAYDHNRGALARCAGVKSWEEALALDDAALIKALILFHHTDQLATPRELDSYQYSQQMFGVEGVASALGLDPKGIKAAVAAELKAEEKPKKPKKEAAGG